MKNTIELFQEKIRDLFKSRNSIDKLMQEKVDDFYLIEEAPVPIIIGGKLMFVGSLTMENMYVFIDMCARIFANIGVQLTSFDILANSDEITKLTMINKKLRKNLMVLIKKSVLSNQDYYMNQIGPENVEKVKLPKVSWRHFKKNITLPTLVQLLFLVYFFNFNSVKKNFRILAEKMEASNLTESYIYTWLANLDGLSGDFVKPQYQKSDFSASESPNEDTLEEVSNG